MYCENGVDMDISKLRNYTISINYGADHSDRDIKYQMSSPARTLGSWVRILLKAWMSVCFYSLFVFSCVSSGLATGSSPVQGVLSSKIRN
jgi:hypothetical protein